MINTNLTPYPDLNELVQVLLQQVQPVLGPQFVGMYLEGSLANDAFDEASDIDFVVVTTEDITDDQFAKLQAIHDQLATRDTRWATELEGSYLGLRSLRRYDPAHAVYPNIERGRGERLKWVFHDAAWVIHLAILRERGITLVGPPPHTLIDPVSPTDIQQAMHSMLPHWTAPILQNPIQIQARGYQSYIVLSLCRVLYSLQHGTIATKRIAMQWALHALPQQWIPLIEHAWAGRFNSSENATAADINQTLAFMRYALKCAGDKSS